MMASVIDLLNTYRPLGTVKAGELLLQPTDALRLADELASIGVPIIGVDIWYRVHCGLAEDPYGLDLSSMLERPNAVATTVATAKEYIRTQLPDYIELVSFVIDDQGWGMATLDE